ncbi:MAG: BMP family ABC transporter substrate-binding protein, partial [Myxococcota bacterium]
VDWAVYEAARDLVEGKLSGGDIALGLAEGAVTYADVTVDFPGKTEALAKVEALEKRIIAKEISVPSNPAALEAFEFSP